MALSYKTDILPLFTQLDIDHMKEYKVYLDQYDYMRRNAQSSYFQLSQRWMPPDDSGEEKWSTEKLQLFKSWMDAGCPP
jgi:hypothetical protein